MKTNSIYKADVFDFLKIIDNESIDLAIIDPPYNMSKADWDTFKSEKESAIAQIKQGTLDEITAQKTKIASLESELAAAKERLSKIGENENDKIRAAEAKSILEFIERARQVEPKGQVVISNKDDIIIVFYEKLF